MELSIPDNAKKLRKSAARLHYSNDQSTRSVYINADLSRGEAQLAYEQRERRRRRKAQTAVSVATMTDPQTTTLSGTGTSASSNDVRTVPDSISLMDTLPSSKSDESATNRVALLSNSHIGTNRLQAPTLIFVHITLTLTC